MSPIDDILAFNRAFVAEKRYAPYAATKYPRKKLAVLSCMDARLTALLPAALGLQNGDFNLVQTAGAMITDPFGGEMRSLLVAVYAFSVEDILVVGHRDCGMEHMDAAALLGKMRDRGIAPAAVDDTDAARWLTGFDDVASSVQHTVGIIRQHPLMPPDVRIHGFVMDPATGQLDGVGKS
ncbi:MAG: carbonic anhydrase [Oscillospiraceae bacterium]|nr:carbonic anhydrase [Oscillospiraceae bacterium]